MIDIDIDPANADRDDDAWSDVAPGDAAAAANRMAYEVGLAAVRSATDVAARLGLLRGLLGEYSRLTRTGPATPARQEKP